MKLYIPTYNRADYPLAGTLRAWPKDLPVNVVVRPEQVEPYEQLIERIGLEAATILPIGKEGIARTRNAILEHADSGTCVMIDDDLQFLIRRDDHEYKLRGASNPEIVRMFKELTTTLEEFAHAAISCREGNNRILEDSVDVTRGIRLVGYNLDMLKSCGITFDVEHEGREDLDMTLKLLEAGYPNRVFYKYAQGQKGSDTAGGLNGSDARTAQKMEHSAKLLESAHPGHVKARTKKTKSAWGGGVRWDVICYWKKAFASSQKETTCM